MKQQLANPAQPYNINDNANYLPGNGVIRQNEWSAQPGQAPAGQQQGGWNYAANTENLQSGLAAGGRAAPQAGAAGQSEHEDTALGLLPFLAAGQPPAGLASLDVKLPWRGTVYFFSTPRGDAEITAQAASGRLLAGLLQAAAIALAAPVVWYVFVAARRGRFTWLANRKTATVLLALGVLGFCLLPGMAILAILAGSGILVQNLLRQTPSPSESER